MIGSPVLLTCERAYPEADRLAKVIDCRAWAYREGAHELTPPSRRGQPHTNTPLPTRGSSGLALGSGYLTTHSGRSGRTWIAGSVEPA